MITRNTKNSRGNRQTGQKTADPLEFIEAAKYPKFRFLLEWLQYIETLTDEVERLNLFLAISEYGMNGTPPNGLQPEHKEYFNTEIRPELDRQHKRLKEGKRI